MSFKITYRHRGPRPLLLYQNILEPRLVKRWYQFPGVQKIVRCFAEEKITGRIFSKTVKLSQLKLLLGSYNSPPLNAESYIVVALLCRWYALWLVKNKNSRHFANIRSHGGIKSMPALDGGYINSIQFPTGQLYCLWLLWLHVVPLFHVFFSCFVSLFLVWFYYTMSRKLCGSLLLPIITAYRALPKDTCVHVL